MSQDQKIEERVSKVSANHRVKKASLPRASKLPHMCLRVDPLPRKKTNGMSSSRSPTPRKVEEIKGKVTVKDKENSNARASKFDIETNKNEQEYNMQGKEAEVMKKKIEIGRDEAAMRI